MKAYQEHFPVVVIGGKAGSFLGEYQAGGLILVLGIGQNGAYPVNNFCGTGMHGGKIVLRCDKAPTGLPPQVLVNEATEADMTHIAPYIKEYARHFGANAADLLEQKVFRPDTEPGGRLQAALHLRGVRPYSDRYGKAPLCSRSFFACPDKRKGGSPYGYHHERSRTVYSGKRRKIHPSGVSATFSETRRILPSSRPS